ncbi:MAG: prephenate dehydratase [Alyxoria varia]|nr:MAG: prephenate dehydratase [Alyxoria varia]
MFAVVTTTIWKPQAAIKAFPSAKLVSHPSIPSVFSAVQHQGEPPKQRPDSNLDNEARKEHDHVKVFTAGESPPAVGIVPLENSTNGPVALTLDVLADLETTFSEVEVEREVRVRVKHCLLGKRRRTRTSRVDNISSGPTRASGLEGNRNSSADEEKSHHEKLRGSPPPKFGRDPVPDLSPYTTIYSHPQVWGQVTSFLHKIGIPSSAISAAGSSALAPAPARAPSNPSKRPNDDDPDTPEDISKEHPSASTIRLNSVSSTSHAATLAAEDPTGSTLAISSALALENHVDSGAEILLQNLEDTPDNVTRFLVLAHRKRSIESVRHTVKKREQDSLRHAAKWSPPKTIKRLIAFMLPPQRFRSPGALADTLNVFREVGLDLTSINARPVGAGRTGKSPWEYSFVVEVLDDNKTATGDECSGSEPLARAASLEEMDGVLSSKLNSVLECGSRSAVGASRDANTTADQQVAAMGQTTREEPRKGGDWRFWGSWYVDGLADGDKEDNATASLCGLDATAIRGS